MPRVAERIEDWWARRQVSRGREVPYEVGAYRSAWASFPMLVQQYHPELNAGIVLSQIPPAADVLLLWQCEVGHLFVATPTAQRGRPSGRRRRSAWCPECTAEAVPARAVPTPMVPARAGATPARAVAVPATRTKGRRRARTCPKTPAIAVGEAFVSVCAPKPASAAEAKLRAAIFGALTVTPGMNAVRVSRPFFDHLEVWPDLLRTAGWEVVRLRTGSLPPLGPHDLSAATISRRGVERFIETLREIRGPLLVDAYRV